MKKRWFFLVVPGMFLLLIVGIWIGTKIDIEQLNSQNNYSNSIKKTIAVVNQDVGKKSEGKNVNYSEAFISSLSNDYKVVSYKEAQQGMDNGEFSAIVTFPSDLSSKVYSINESTLQSPKIEFSVNPSLTESGYIETYLKVLNLQNEINDTLSYLYVSSIYDEVHSAQDEVKEIFENDEDDMLALEDVKLHDFRLNVNWSDIPEVEFTPTEINFNEFVSTVQGYADNMSQKYVDSYKKAQNDYEVFQKDFSVMANSASESGLQWYDKVYNREQNVSNYVDLIRGYRNDINLWSENLYGWNKSTETWLENINDYYSKVDGWKNNVFSWKNDMDTWGSGFITDMDTYKNSITSYKNAVDDYLENVCDHYVSSTADWSLQYTEYADNTKLYLQNLKTYVEDYNKKVNIDNKYIGDMSDYKAQLTEYQTDINNCASSLISEYFEPLKSFHTELNNTYFGVENDEENNGLISDVNNYYDALIQYEEELNSYKLDLDDYKYDLTNYAIIYADCINYYWQQYYMDNTDVSPPDFNINDMFNQIDTHDSDFSDTKSIINDKKDRVDAYTEREISSLDFTRNKLQTDFADLLSREQISIPDSPDYSDISEDGTIPLIDTNILNDYIEADLEEWDRTFNIVTPNPEDYIVLNTTAAPTVISEFSEVSPIFEGGVCPTLEVNEPLEIQDEVPAVPEGFISNCNSIVSESKKYVPYNYLTEDTKLEVNSIVDMYADNLVTVESRLTNNMNSNNNMLNHAYNQYNSYVNTLHTDANTAYMNKENDLNNTLGVFYKAKEATSIENKELLSDFSEKLPNSRVNSVVNKELVNFTVSPVNMIPGDIRSTEHLGVTQQEQRLDMYEYLIMLTAFLVVISLLIVLAIYRRDSKRNKKSL